jgi:uncharacterized membrane protein
MNAKSTVVLLTLFMLAYFILMASSISEGWKDVLIAVSPVIFIGSVILVLRDRSSDYPELEEGEEYGYVDRPDLKQEKD